MVFYPEIRCFDAHPSKQNHFKGHDGFYGSDGSLVARAACVLFFNQRRLLLLTGIMTAGFVASRLGGLLIDGVDQHFTYIELGFELVALVMIIAVYTSTRRFK